MIAVLYESGCRIGELASLQIGNVQFDSNGAVMSVIGKTGARTVRIISSTPYMATWIQSHHKSDDPNAPLWINIGCTNHNQMMQYRAISSMLKRTFDRAGIKKRCNPHMFRHSRATFLANHLTEFQMNQCFGWIQGSDMPSTYLHMSGKNIDDALLNLNGVKNEN